MDLFAAGLIAMVLATQELRRQLRIIAAVTGRRFRSGSGASAAVSSV
jgi:hypothetical protein